MNRQIWGRLQALVAKVEMTATTLLQPTNNEEEETSVVDAQARWAREAPVGSDNRCFACSGANVLCPQHTIPIEQHPWTVRIRVVFCYSAEARCL